jgi:hypothetical protein
MKVVLRLMLMVVLAVPVFAADEMKKLDFLAGEWKGEGWFRMGPGEPQHVIQHEKVTPKAGGAALLIEGVGRSKKADGTAGDVVHNAAALLGWDEQAKKYIFSTAVAGRGATTPWLEVRGDQHVVWGMDVPMGKMRYTITLNEKGEWFEVGEFSRDGNQWSKFFEMTLAKVK